MFRGPLRVERVLKWDIACQQGVAIVTVTLVYVSQESRTRQLFYLIKVD